MAGLLISLAPLRVKFLGLWPWVLFVWHDDAYTLLLDV